MIRLEWISILIINNTKIETSNIHQQHNNMNQYQSMITLGHNPEFISLLRNKKPLNDMQVGVLFTTKVESNHKINLSFQFDPVTHSALIMEKY